jgi:hypothetical protein
VFFQLYECTWLHDPHGWVGLRTFYAETANIYGFRLERYELDLTTQSLRCVDSSPEVTWDYTASRGLFETKHGKWPVPKTLVSALVRHDIGGQSRDDAVYDVYWMGLLHSQELRDWIAKYDPEYWASVQNLVTDQISIQEEKPDLTDVEFSAQPRRNDHRYRWSPDGPECDLCGFMHDPDLEPEFDD